MRVTKKILREAKAGMRHRIIELCAMLHTGGLKSEWERCFPGVTSFASGREDDAELMRSLLIDLLETALPAHWHE